MFDIKLKITFITKLNYYIVEENCTFKLTDERRKSQFLQSKKYSNHLNTDVVRWLLYIKNLNEETSAFKIMDLIIRALT